MFIALLLADLNKLTTVTCLPWVVPGLKILSSGDYVGGTFQ
jgi:hypothetical protein